MTFKLIHERREGVCHEEQGLRVLEGKEVVEREVKGPGPEP